MRSTKTLIVIYIIYSTEAPAPKRRRETGDLAYNVDTLSAHAIFFKVNFLKPLSDPPCVWQTCKAHINLISPCTVYVYLYAVDYSNIGALEWKNHAATLHIGSTSSALCEALE